MGAGGYAAGDGPPGGDPVVSTGGPRRVTYPRAILFLAQDRGFPLDDDGRCQDIHPTDQKVALALYIVRGALAANADVGHTLRSVRPTSTERTHREVVDAVNVALAAIVAAGEIKILEVVSEVPQRGSLLVSVTYFNVLLQTERTAQFTAS